MPASCSASRRFSSCEAVDIRASTAGRRRRRSSGRRPSAARPAPAASARDRASAFISSWMSWSSMALWISGRFKVMVAMFLLVDLAQQCAHGRYILNMPKLVVSIGALSAADRPRPSTMPAVGRIDDAVVPQPRARVIGMALLLVLGADRRLEGLLLVRAPFLLLGGEAVALHLRQHVGGLVAAHHGDARVRPHPEEAGREGAAAHAVIAGAEAAADDAA